jgi:DegV family protein with EDD domain
MIRIVTDSSSGISPHLAAEMGVTVMPLKISFGAEVYRDGVDIDREGFYRNLTRAAVLPTIQPPTLAEFQEVYGRVLSVADQILAIHLSSSMSKTARVAREAAKAFWGRNKITVVDSRMVSWGLKLLVSFAADALRRGALLEETVRLIRGSIPHVYMVFYAENSEYWDRHGRRVRDRAFGETLPGVRPLLIIEDGRIVPLDRVRSRGRSVDRLFEFLAEFARFEQAVVLGGRWADDAQALFGQLVEAFPDKRLDLQPYGPALASYLGPAALGIGVYEGY